MTRVACSKSKIFATQRAFCKKEKLFAMIIKNYLLKKIKKILSVCKSMSEARLMKNRLPRVWRGGVSQGARVAALIRFITW
jgi:hypothetical protein